jgi:hypothetical protein
MDVRLHHVNSGQRNQVLCTLASARRHHHAVALLRQLRNDMAADKSATAEYQVFAHLNLL